MKKSPKRILFYYLSAFSNTGGIEKFNRCFIKAMDELIDENNSVTIVSVYDELSDKRYNEKATFVGFAKNRGRSVKYILKHAREYDLFVIGHINLAIVGLMVKLLNPKCKLVVIAHGIEVWPKLRLFKKWCLKKADLILAVSNYTKNQLVLRNSVSPSRISLFPNTIDPYFSIPAEFSKTPYLLERYNLSVEQPIIFTLSRLVSSEKYKGYDVVISALPLILDKVPNAVYILAGKYDEIEKNRIQDLIRIHQVEKHVILAGYIKDEEITDHYRTSDIFIMPSRKEGFGIVFLEALACGTNVIGGNQDGTVDALHNGSLGKLINPTKTSEIAEAILQQLENEDGNPELIQQRVLDKYRFVRYKKRLEMNLFN